MRVYHFSKTLLCIVILWTAACRTAPDPIPLQLPIASSTISPIVGLSPTKPVTVAPSSTTQPEIMPTEVLSTSTPAMQICAPLPGYSLLELTEAVSNPFKPPARPGSDDPHQAIDLAVEKYGIALTGETVQAILSGRVAAIVEDRFPYGNALIIETRLENLPAMWLANLKAPTPAPTFGPHPALTCPQVDDSLTWEKNSRSLYLLYAHMLEPLELRLDDPVGCGEMIGRIGQSGNALNPHLHLETRAGPSGARFDSMAHYSGGITPEEMSNYCIWRVSGLFQLIDPMEVLELLP